MKKPKSFKKKFVYLWTFRDTNGFSLVETIVAVTLLALLTMGGFVITGKLQESAQQTIVENAVNEVYTSAFSIKELSKNDNSNPAFLAADEWVRTSDKESSKGVDLRGFMVDENGEITEDREATVVIVGVAKGLGYDKDGYPYLYWRTTLDTNKSHMWNLIQKHNEYSESNS